MQLYPHDNPGLYHTAPRVANLSAKEDDLGSRREPIFVPSAVDPGVLRHEDGKPSRRLIPMPHGDIPTYIVYLQLG